MVNKSRFKILTETGQVIKKIIRGEDGTVIAKILERHSLAENPKAPLFTIGKKIETSKPMFNTGQPPTDLMEKRTASRIKFGPTEIDETSYGIMQRALNPESLDLKLASRLFKEQTGIQLHSPTQWHLEPFKSAIFHVVDLKEKGLLPPEIKHFLIGHGTGSSTNGTWIFSANGKNVFNYINKNIPRSEIALVSTCEDAHSAIAGKPGIGFEVFTHLGDPTRPGKIVRSGTNEIIGHFVNGKITYY